MAGPVPERSRLGRPGGDFFRPGGHGGPGEYGDNHDFQGGGPVSIGEGLRPRRLVPGQDGGADRRPGLDRGGLHPHSHLRRGL